VSKLGHIIRKNLLLLFRKKSTAFVILFGPLAIILLIGLAFTTSSSYEVALGYYTPEDTALVGRFVGNMEDNGFIVEEFDRPDSCIEAIQTGSLQTCIEFPEDFAITNNRSNEIIFYVDQSRTNFVYQVIESVSSNLGVESEELSQDLTSNILNVLSNTRAGVDNAVDELVKAKASASGLASEADTARSTAAGMNLSSDGVDTSLVETYYEELDDAMVKLRDDAQALVTTSKDLDDEMEASLSNESYEDFTDAVDTLESQIDTNEEDEEMLLNSFDDAIGLLKDSLDELESKLEDAEDTQQETLDQIDALQDQADAVLEDLDDVKSDLEGLIANIDRLEVTSSETITNPITTTIEHITSRNSKLAYMFPYLLMLVAMFVGLLLSGTLIMMEKSSKSSFRTFCTPTKEELLMLGNFLTSFIVVLVQMAIIVGIAYYFIGDSLLGNVPVSLLIVVLGVVVFIILGMALGYLLSSQEAVTMISISLASVFLFLSNLILPLETLSQQLQQAVSFNPYVITSEALRKALLFHTEQSKLNAELWTLVGYSVAVFVFLVLVRELMRSKISQKLAFARNARLFDDPSELYLHVQGKEIRNLRELMEWLEAVDDKTFREHLTWHDLRAWLKKNRMRKMLRVKLAGKTRQEMVDILEKEVEKRKR